MFRDCCVALPHDSTGLSAVCDWGISWSYSIFWLNTPPCGPVVYTYSVLTDFSSWKLYLFTTMCQITKCTSCCYNVCTLEIITIWIDNSPDCVECYVDLQTNKQSVFQYRMFRVLSGYQDINLVVKQAICLNFYWYILNKPANVKL